MALPHFSVGITITLQMKEVNYILQNATGNSLVIIDELGRGKHVEG